MHVLVNAPNLTAAGPRSLAMRLLPCLGPAAPDVRITAVLPDTPEYRGLDLADNITPLWWPRAESRPDLARLRQLYFDVPRVAAELGPDVCLTLGDIAPLSLRCPQVVFLHLALLVYEPDELAGLDAWSSGKRRYLEWHFRRAARKAVTVIVQTPVMAERLRRRYGVPDRRIAVIGHPAAAPRSAAVEPPAAMRGCEKPVRLLFPAAHYPHKNHRVLPAVAAQLRRRGLDARVQLFVTLDEADPAALGILRELAPASDVVTNLGRIPVDRVAGAWSAAHALFLPTLVESFGLTYVEAMAEGCTILTSDRDFARWMCGRAALYFEPLDPRSIVGAIERFIQLRSGAPPREDEMALADARAPRAEADTLLARFPNDWAAVADRFMAVTMAAAATRQQRGLAGARH